MNDNQDLNEILDYYLSEVKKVHKCDIESVITTICLAALTFTVCSIFWLAAFLKIATIISGLI